MLFIIQLHIYFSIHMLLPLGLGNSRTRKEQGNNDNKLLHSANVDKKPFTYKGRQ